MKSRDNKIFKGLLFSHLSVLVIPIIIIGSIVMTQFIHILEKDVKTSMLASLNQVKQSLDIRMKEVEEISYQLGSSRSVMKLLNETQADNADEILNILDITNEMKLLTIPNKFITDLYIYVDKANILISPSSKYSFPFYYDEMMNYKGLSATQWLERIKQYIGRQYWESMPIRNNENKRVITYARSLPINNRINQGSVIMLIDEENIENLFMGDRYDQNSSFLIVEKPDKVLFTTNQELDIREFSFPDIMDREGFFEYSRAGNENICMYVLSDVNEFIYVAIVPRYFVMEKVNSIRNLIIILILACTIIGILFAYFRSLKSYQPICNVFDMLQKLQVPGEDSVKRDYSIIHKAINDIVAENKKLEERISHHTPNIKLNFLSRLVSGKFKDPAEIRSIMEMINLAFISNTFCSLAINIDDCSEFIRESDDNQLSLVKFIIFNVVEEIISKENVAFVFEEEERIIVLINFKKGRNMEACEKDTINMIHGIIGFFTEKMHIALSVGMGNVYNEFRMIGESYKEACTALNYRIVKGRNMLLQYNQISFDSSNYYYPLDMEMKLINHVKAGDYEGAEQLLDLIFSENFIKRKLPLKLIQCVSFDIVGTILKLLQEVNINYYDALGEELDVINRLLKNNILEEMKQDIKEILSKVCKHLTDHRVSKNSELRSKIIEYIENNYINKNVSLISASDDLGISSSYLSKVFKDYTGYNFADYLNRVRIKKAKELLQKDDLLINDIADLVGYCSGNTFIRIFKKYEAITPGQFKAGTDGLAR